MSNDRDAVLNTEICIHGMDIVGLYLFLKKNEGELEEKLLRLYRSLERTLFESLSIDSFENLNNFYDTYKER